MAGEANWSGRRAHGQAILQCCGLGLCAGRRRDGGSEASLQGAQGRGSSSAADALGEVQSESPGGHRDGGVGWAVDRSRDEWFDGRFVTISAFLALSTAAESLQANWCQCTDQICDGLRNEADTAISWTCRKPIGPKNFCSDDAGSGIGWVSQMWLANLWLMRFCTR